MRLLATALILALAACTPEIGTGTYFCGPERLCPPELSCDDTSYTCIAPSSVDPFVCPEGFDDTEPDDEMSTAQDLGELDCGLNLLQAANSCLQAGSGADYYTFTYNGNCQGANPHLAIQMRYPIALVPLQLELIDGNGTVVATGDYCTQSNDSSGRESLCIDTPPVTGTTYFVKVSRDPDGPDCDGDCDFNQYLLNIAFPLAGS